MADKQCLQLMHCSDAHVGVKVNASSGSMPICDGYAMYSSRLVAYPPHSSGLRPWSTGSRSRETTEPVVCGSRLYLWGGFIHAFLLGSETPITDITVRPDVAS